MRTRRAQNHAKTTMRNSECAAQSAPRASIYAIEAQNQFITRPHSTPTVRMRKTRWPMRRPSANIHFFTTF